MTVERPCKYIFDPYPTPVCVVKKVKQQGKKKIERQLKYTPKEKGTFGFPNSTHALCRIKRLGGTFDDIERSAIKYLSDRP